MLAFATVGAAFNYWGAIRLRLSDNLKAMIGVQVLSTVVMLGLAAALVSHGTVWVAAAWGIGHFVGGVAGYVASVTFARFPDDVPDRRGPDARRRAHEEPAQRRRTILRVLRVTLRVLSRVVPQSRSVVVSVPPGDRGQRARGRARPAGEVRRPRGLAA